MISVGKLAKMFNISRTALLYYDDIGLLKPSGKTEAGYRLYSETDAERLSKIMLLKEAGARLEDIFILLEASEEDSAALLLKQLGELNKNISAIKKQQDRILKILKNASLFHGEASMNKAVWLSRLSLSGINEENADEWHAQFEKHSPEQHQQFLELLGFSQVEILSIRQSAQKT